MEEAASTNSKLSPEKKPKKDRSEIVLATVFAAKILENQEMLLSNITERKEGVEEAILLSQVAEMPAQYKEKIDGLITKVRAALEQLSDKSDAVKQSRDAMEKPKTEQEFTDGSKRMLMDKTDVRQEHCLL